jgi:hypothetical protein
MHVELAPGRNKTVTPSGGRPGVLHGSSRSQRRPGHGGKVEGTQVVDRVCRERGRVGGKGVSEYLWY